MSGVFVFRQPPQGFHTEYFGGGGGKGGTTVQSTQIPPEVLARYNAVNARAEKVADNPFQRYGGEFVAPINEQQTAGISGVNAAANQAQPYYNAATGLTMSGAQDVGPLTQQQIGYYQNPYTQSVVDPTVKAMQQQFGQQNAAQQAQAIKGGAFGGERAGLQRSVLQGQQGLAQAQAISPLYERGYTNAAELAKSQQGVVAGDYARRIQAGQQVANLGTAAQTAALQGSQAQIAAGTLQQQTAQAKNTALYQQHLQEQGYPFQVAQFLANIAEGTGALSGNTSTQNKSGGFFSNRGGFKVNERPARAYGGGLDVNSMGGAVYDPGHYADGGDVQMADILASQQAMFQGMGTPYGQGQKPGAGLGIPSQTAKITPLQVKPIAQEAKGANPLTTAANFGKDVVGLKNAGTEIKGWFDKGKGPTAPADGKTSTVTDPTKGGVLADSKGNVTVQGQAVPIGTNNGQTPTGPVYSGPKVEGAPAAGEKLGFGPEIKDMGVGSGFDASNTNQAADLGGFSDMGGEQVADLGSSLGDFGSWFGNRGGAVPDYATGGLVPRQAASTGKFVTPGYDPELPGTDIMDTVDESGMQSAGQLKNEQESMNPKISGGGGGDSGIGQALGTALTIGKFFLKDGGRANPFAYGGLAYREHHDGSDGNKVGQSPSLDDDKTLGLISKFEGYREKPYYDVNALRAGFGSDTTTLPSGEVRTVDENTRVNMDDAKRDLARRAKEFQGHIQKSVGDDSWKALDPNAQAALTSTTYNYGRLPNSVAKAVQSGDREAMGRAVNALGAHNDGINARRRAEEASLIHPEGNYMASLGAPRPPMDIGRAAKGDTASGTYGGNSAKAASIGDVVREYTPSGVPTSENFWVPALGFLGGMLTSPNRSLAGAIGSGLVSGTSGYMELRKGQQEDIKNAFTNFKDQFEDALDPKTGLPAKKNKYTGEFVAPNEVQDVLAKRLRSIGVDPANYGVMESKAPAAAKTATGTSGPLPPPVAGEKAPEPESVIQYAAKLGIDIPQKPPADMPRTEMSPAQLKANAFWNWKQEGLSQDPASFLKRIDEYRKKSDAWSSVGGEKAQAEATRFNNMAKEQSESLAKMLEDATKQDTARNLKITESQVERANKHVDAGVQRSEKLNQALSDIDQLAYLQNAGLSSGYGSGVMNRMQSLYQRVTGEKMPLTGQNPNDYEYAVKIAAARVASAIKEIGGQRAPGVTSALEGKIAPDPENLTPGAIHKLLGQAKADALYNQERDKDFALNHRYDDPGKHVYTYDETPDDKGYTQQHKYNRKLAEAYSSLPLPTKDPYLSDLTKELNDQYGKYGYSPNQRGMKDVSAPAAPTVAPGQRVGEEKQFKQGVGVWDGSKWVPKGQQ